MLWSLQRGKGMLASKRGIGQANVHAARYSSDNRLEFEDGTEVKKVFGEVNLFAQREVSVRNFIARP